MNNSKSMNDFGRILLIVVLIVSLIWSVSSFSFEALSTLLTAVAGIVASYELLKEYRIWGRIALVVATIVSLAWVLTSLEWASIVAVLTSAIGAISSFSDEESWDLFPVAVGRESNPGMTSRIVFTLLAWGSWVLVWYACLYWGFNSYIPGLLIDIADMAAPAPQSWLLNNSMGFLIWFGLVGLIITLPFDWREIESVFLAGFLAVIASIITAWVSYLVYVAHSWNLGDLFASLFVMIFAHMLLIGFIASIGMALFGIGVATIWTGIMMMVIWVATMTQRFFALDAT